MSERSERQERFMAELRGENRSAPESRVYTQADVDFLHDNADEYFAKWLAADARIRAAAEALNDTTQFCTERVVRALDALTTGDSGALPDSPAAPPEEEK